MKLSGEQIDLLRHMMKSVLKCDEENERTGNFDDAVVLTRQLYCLLSADESIRFLQLIREANDPDSRSPK